MRSREHVTGHAAQIAHRVLTHAARSLAASNIFTSYNSVPSHAIPPNVNDYLNTHFDYLREISVTETPVAREGRPSVNVLGFFHSVSFYGGIATLLITAAGLAKQLDYNLRIIQTKSNSKVVDIHKFLTTQGIDFNPSRVSVEILLGDGTSERRMVTTADDVFVVSAWWDAYAVSSMRRTLPFIYLIQDYEPIFYANSDASLFAEATYQSTNFVPVINSSVLSDFFNAQGYALSKRAIVFEPAVMTSLPVDRILRDCRYSLFLYARPEVPRNLFVTSIRAIDDAFTRLRLTDENWAVCMGGSNELPPLHLSNGMTVTSLGKLDVDDYRKLLGNVDVAVSPMLSPHPNYPTLEFAKAGARVVTTRWATKTDLLRYGGAITMSEPTTTELCLSIAGACREVEQTHGARTAGFTLNGSWAQTSQEVATKIVTQLGLPALRS